MFKNTRNENISKKYCWWGWYEIIVSCIFVQNITKAGFQYKPRIFFLFCDLDFIDYLVTFGGIHEYFWQENLKTIGGIHETR